MKDLLRVFVGAIFMWVLLFSPCVADAAERSESDYRANGITVMVSAAWHPYSFVDETGKPSGFLVSYWQKWSHVTGIPVRFKVAVWAETLEQVLSGEADLQSGLFTNEEREKVFDFTQPVIPVNGALIVDPTQGATCETLLTDYTVGTSHKGHSEFVMRTLYPKTKLATYRTGDELINALVNGAVQGVLIDYPGFVYRTSRDKLTDRFTYCTSLYEQQLLGGVKKGNATLLRLLKQGISQIGGNEREVLVQKWFVEKRAEVNYWKYLGPAGILLFVALGFFIGVVNHASRSKADKV